MVGWTSAGEEDTFPPDILSESEGRAMLDPFAERLKKQYELRVLETLMARCYPLEEITDLRRRRAILEEAEVFYRDHIHGMVGTDATHHDVAKRFPSLNEAMRKEISAFAERMAEAGEEEGKIEGVLAAWDVRVSFSSERLKALLKSR